MHFPLLACRRRSVAVVLLLLLVVVVVVVGLSEEGSRWSIVKKDGNKPQKQTSLCASIVVDGAVEHGT